MTRRLMLIALVSVAIMGPVRAEEQAMRNVPRITIDEVKALIAKQQVILVDVRDPQSFAEGHMPGALNVPFDHIPKYVDAWKKDARMLITYCACTNETTAARAVVDMNAFGITNAKALLGGWHEWIRRGEKVER